MMGETKVERSSHLRRKRARNQVRRKAEIVCDLVTVPQFSRDGAADIVAANVELPREVGEAAQLGRNGAGQRHLTRPEVVRHDSELAELGGDRAREGILAHKTLCVGEGRRGRVSTIGLSRYFEHAHRDGFGMGGVDMV